MAITDKAFGNFGFQEIKDPPPFDAAHNKRDENTDTCKNYQFLLRLDGTNVFVLNAFRKEDQLNLWKKTLLKIVEKMSDL